MTTPDQTTYSSHILFKGKNLYGDDTIRGDQECISKCTRVWTDYNYWGGNRIVNSYDVVCHDYDTNGDIIRTTLKFNIGDSIWRCPEEKLWLRDIDISPRQKRSPINILDSNGNIIGDMHLNENIIHILSHINLCHDQQDYITHAVLVHSTDDVEDGYRKEHFRGMSSTLHILQDGTIRKLHNKK